jgi:hypothetical protein
MEADHEDKHACKEIIASLESRWSKADQEPFIASIILNPVYRLQPFAPLPYLHRANIIGLMIRLFKRFFNAEPSAEFTEDVLNYLGQKGNFMHLPDMINYEIGVAKAKVWLQHWWSIPI